MPGRRKRHRKMLLRLIAAASGPAKTVKCGCKKGEMLNQLVPVLQGLAFVTLICVAAATAIKLL